MKTLPATFLAAVIAIFGVLAVPGTSHASCTGSNRLSLDEAYCLDGGWNNSCNARIFGKCISWSSTYWVEADYFCTQGNTVVAKIDLKGHTDKTWHQNDSNRRSGSHGTTTVNGIYCCKDLGFCIQTY